MSLFFNFDDCVDFDGSGSLCLTDTADTVPHGLSAQEPSSLGSGPTLVRRNPAFRVAIGGLTVAVGLCLVGAISLLHLTPPAEISGVAGGTNRVMARAPLQVATAGDESHLLDEHPRVPVPEPLDEHVLTELPTDPHEQAPMDDELPGPWTPRPTGDEPQYVELPPPPEFEPVQLAANSLSNVDPPPTPTTGLNDELAHLKGQVSELARTQLEAQLAEIRRAEQLLSAHQTNRMIEALQRDVDELKEQRVGGVPVPGSPVEPTEPDHSLATTPPVPENISPEASAAASEPARVPLTRVRFTETSEAVGRYDVDADAASLQEMLLTLGPVAGWNLVSGPELQGTVTCRWKGVDLQQALTQLLKVHGWLIRQDGDFAIVESLPPLASAQSADEAPAPMTLELASETSGLLPPVSGSPDFPPTTQFRQATQASRPTYMTESRPVSFGSEGTAPPRTGRIVMKDYPELMAQGTPPARRPAETPQAVEIEATILEIRPTREASRGLFRQALWVADQSPCPRCGVVHHGVVEVGHSAEGWVELGEGLSSGVCQMTPEAITAKLQQLSTTTVTATPRVYVLNRQLAEIGLSQRPGFRRLIVRAENGSPPAAVPSGDVRLSLRPSVDEGGLIRLDLQPASAPSTEFSASLHVPQDSCVVLGGLYFESERTTDPAGSTPLKDQHEVVVLIRVRPLENGVLTAPLPPVSTPTEAFAE